jgi:hypothetical protein
MPNRVIISPGEIAAGASDAVFITPARIGGSEESAVTLRTSGIVTVPPDQSICALPW